MHEIVAFTFYLLNISDNVRRVAEVRQSSIWRSPKRQLTVTQHEAQADERSEELACPLAPTSNFTVEEGNEQIFLELRLNVVRIPTLEPYGTSKTQSVTR